MELDLYEHHILFFHIFIYILFSKFHIYFSKVFCPTHKESHKY